MKGSNDMRKNNNKNNDDSKSKMTSSFDHIY